MNTINKGVNSLISACLYNEESIIEITFIFIKMDLQQKYSNLSV